MDYDEILLTLTTNNNEETTGFDDQLRRILEKVLRLLPEDTVKLITEQNLDEPVDVRYQYLQTIAFVLQKIQKVENKEDDGLFSINQFRTMKVAIELIVSIGIIPCLLPGVGVDMAKLCPRATQLCEEKISDLQKYDRLRFSARSLVDLYNNTIFRPAIISQFGPLLAALLQLSHAPLMKPSTQSNLAEDEKNKSQFNMTPELYSKLKKDQEEYSYFLHQLLINCPQPSCIKELMVIHGTKQAPNWLRRKTREYLIDRIMQPNGIISILAAVCDDILDLGEHWNKLDTVARLIATSHGNNPEEYYKSICPQLLNLLLSKQIKHSATIANCCITALYDSNADVCVKNIVEVMCSPLRVKPSDEKVANVTHGEKEVEQCIEALTKCFITIEAKFKQLSIKLISNVATPLFCLYNDTRQSVCILKTKIKQLLLRFLYEETLRKNLFAAFLGHDTTSTFGYYVTSRFGPTGGVEIVEASNNPKYEEFADNLYDLVSTAEALSIDLFAYLLIFLSDLIKSGWEGKPDNLLQSDEDVVECIQKQIAALTLLSNLASTSIVQEAYIKNPEPLISFIKSLFHEYIKNNENPPEDNDCEVLYVSLMLIKMILNENSKCMNWEPFAEFAKFLKGYCDQPNVPAQLSLLTQEVIDLIETRGRSERKQYQDLSVDHKSSNKFEEAIRDLSDPLLPVRAHGLITLTKLIETMDPCAIARRAVILKLFQENLKHEDSFIYLAAINGLCALATTYPKVIIETLVQEFIDMPQRISSGDITSETRIKLGEILVKTTRALGEMATAYKNILVNGFLCATRDPDSLVRASSLSCLGELCKVLGFRLGNIVIEVIYCISCIIKSDKAPECRRAAVMVGTLLLRGLGQDTLTSLGKDLVDLFRGLKYLRDNDDDPVLRLHAQLALEEFDHIVRDFLFAKPRLEKRIFLLEPPS